MTKAIHFDISPYNHHMLKKIKETEEKGSLNEALELAITYYETLKIALVRFPEITDIMILANKRREKDTIERLRKNKGLIEDGKKSIQEKRF